MYELTEEVLHAAGYVHYEISNWARPGFESQHNLTYWLNEPYLGFGAGAHSSWQGSRYENIKNPGQYIARATKRESVVASSQVIEREMQMAEMMFLGLRLIKGVEWARLAERFGEDGRIKYKEQIEVLTGQGLAEVDQVGIRLTRKGMLLSNQVLWRFLPDREE
jgi:oxygen-independent coproporphyrinogen-3 oxidase